MTVSSSNDKNTYVGDGVDLTFPFTFQITDEDDILVQIKDANGTITTKTIATDYTVSGTGNDTGKTNYLSGDVTFLVAPLATETIILIRSMDFLQQVDYQENAPFPAETHEDALDKLTMMCQQLKEENERFRYRNVKNLYNEHKRYGNKFYSN